MFFRFIILGKPKGFYNILFHLFPCKRIKIVFEFLPSLWVNVKKWVGWFLEVCQLWNNLQVLVETFHVDSWEGSLLAWPSVSGASQCTVKGHPLFLGEICNHCIYQTVALLSSFIPNIWKNGTESIKSELSFY